MISLICLLDGFAGARWLLLLGRPQLTNTSAPHTATGYCDLQDFCNEEMFGNKKNGKNVFFAVLRRF